jgi:hypothetical protein
MRSLTDPPSPRRVTVAAAVLGLLAALMFSSGWAPVAGVHAGEFGGDQWMSAVGLGEPMATIDAYRRSDAPRRPQHMPAAVAVAAMLVALALPALYRLASGPFEAAVQRRHVMVHPRGPPHLFLA